MTLQMRLNNSITSKAIITPKADFGNVDTTPIEQKWNSFFKLANAILRKDSLDKNFIDDFAYLLFAKGMLSTSLMVDNNRRDADIVSVKKGDYHTIKQINRRVEFLYKELDAVADKYFYMIPKSAKKAEKMLNSVLALREGKNLQLDYLACYVLKMRFMPIRGRSTPIHESMSWLASKNSQVISIMDLLDKTEEAEKDEKMAELAKYVCKNL